MWLLESSSYISNINEERIKSQAYREKFGELLSMYSTQLRHILNLWDRSSKVAG